MHEKQRTVYLNPPSLSDYNIKEKITCVRAHRERIFRTDVERIDSKQIFHNYGQGGAGFTFLFGCVHASIRQFQEHASSCTSPITIIGAGCYGLLTATILARKGYDVQIIAEQTDSLASHRAAGFFFPRPRKSSTHEESATFLAYGIESYETYLKIIQANHPFLNAGAHLIPAYYDPSIDPGFSAYHKLKLITEPENVRIDFGNGKSYDAREYTTLFIDVTALMRELERNITELNIPIVKKKVFSFEEIESPIIFNCTGLGARELTHDKRLIPVQGHLITLRDQPHKLSYMINAHVDQRTLRGYTRKELVYFAPKDEGILGITFLRGQNGTINNDHEFDRLLERAHLFFGI